jgi:amino acid adenylation domain-containing protein
MSLAPTTEEVRVAGAQPASSTIAALFSRQAALTPDAIAVIANDTSLTYRELDERSDRLAEYLQSLGVKPDTLTGIAMDRRAALIVGLLGILKAGGAYVPLDPHYPPERLSWIIEDSAMPVVLTNAQTEQSLSSIGTLPSVLDVDDLPLLESNKRRVRACAVGRDLAYVIYTSGSTGKPKGVMVEHRNVLNFFAAMDQAIGGEPGVWLAVTSVSFDISVLELLWTLTRGFTVVLHRDEGYATVADEIARHNVTHLQMTPSLARILMLDQRAFVALGSLRKILLGGEAVPASLVRHLRQVFEGDIYNMYGPTETTIWSTCGRIDEIGATISIGRPVLNTQIFIFDPEHKPVAPGDAGELYIAGDGVARGYWNRPDLTAERFLSIPSLSATRLYITGDLVRVRPDGNIEFLGRVDYQIKLRGHRIEPGEIETVLEECPGVQRAVVVLREDREDDMRLVAYVVADVVGENAAANLRHTLAARLPDFMVPSNIVFLSELRLTDNGKIDRKALLQLPPPAPAPERTSASLPVTAMEQLVANAWKDALGLPAVGLNDNFFDLGAHSLTVAEVHARLQEVLGHEFDLVDLFQFSTVSTLATHLAGASRQSQTSDRAQRRRMAMQH